MKKCILFVISVIMTACACDNVLGFIKEGNGVKLATTFEVGEFDKISVVGSVDVRYTQTAGEQFVELTCDDNLFEYYVVSVENRTLSVKTKSGVWLKPEAETYLTVHSPNLNSVDVSGSGDCFLNSDLTSEGDFSYKVSGSGDLFSSYTVSCRDFTAKVSGSGDFVLRKLNADKAGFGISGSGNISVDGLTAESISINITGSGDGEITCIDAGDIDVSISGSGDVILRGNARSLNSKIHGSGNVDRDHLTLSN